ncbi:hypothetical protein CPLU01_09782 [Colletotrichum plurivorum]|uniref:Uncharacterized protein n=1 Tax=Colletotrichum plurivorum TaxID=2175906 RepID=A0A8H6K7N7_9PEZI|nr:hypothetical protein CPLU01_09782 [Colletotrichum plurivorum]
MRFFSAIATTVLLLASGSQAWTKDKNGVWVANNQIYRFDNGEWVHEACTKMNTAEVHRSGSCAYWIDGNGNMHKGNCATKPGMVMCW